MTHEKWRLVEWLRAELARAPAAGTTSTSTRLDAESLQDLQHLLRDLNHEKQAPVNRARIMPWRRG